MDKKKYYEEIKRKIASDGKSHQSCITKKGIIIDGKLYTGERKHIPENRKIRKK